MMGASSNPMVSTALGGMLAFVDAKAGMIEEEKMRAIIRSVMAEMETWLGSEPQGTGTNEFYFGTTVSSPSETSPIS